MPFTWSLESVSVSRPRRTDRNREVHVDFARSEAELPKDLNLGNRLEKSAHERRDSQTHDKGEARTGVDRARDHCLGESSCRTYYWIAGKFLLRDLPVGHEFLAGVTANGKVERRTGDRLEMVHQIFCFVSLVDQQLNC